MDAVLMRIFYLLLIGVTLRSFSTGATIDMCSSFNGTTEQGSKLQMLVPTPAYQPCRCLIRHAASYVLSIRRGGDYILCQDAACSDCNNTDIYILANTEVTIISNATARGNITIRLSGKSTGNHFAVLCGSGEQAEAEMARSRQLVVMDCPGAGLAAASQYQSLDPVLLYIIIIGTGLCVILLLGLVAFLILKSDRWKQKAQHKRQRLVEKPSLPESNGTVPDGFDPPKFETYIDAFHNESSTDNIDETDNIDNNVLNTDQTEESSPDNLDDNFFSKNYRHDTIPREIRLIDRALENEGYDTNTLDSRYSQRLSSFEPPAVVPPPLVIKEINNEAKSLKNSKTVEIPDISSKQPESIGSSNVPFMLELREKQARRDSGILADTPSPKESNSDLDTHMNNPAYESETEDSDGGDVTYSKIGVVTRQETESPPKAEPPEGEHIPKLFRTLFYPDRPATPESSGLHTKVVHDNPAFEPEQEETAQIVDPMDPKPQSLFMGNFILRRKDDNPSPQKSRPISDKVRGPDVQDKDSNKYREGNSLYARPNKNPNGSKTDISASTSQPLPPHPVMIRDSLIEKEIASAFPNSVLPPPAGFESNEPPSPSSPLPPPLPPHPQTHFSKPNGRPKKQSTIIRLDTPVMYPPPPPTTEPPPNTPPRKPKKVSSVPAAKKPKRPTPPPPEFGSKPPAAAHAPVAIHPKHGRYGRVKAAKLPYYQQQEDNSAMHIPVRQSSHLMKGNRYFAVLNNELVMMNADEDDDLIMGSNRAVSREASDASSYLNSSGTQLRNS